MFSPGLVTLISSFILLLVGISNYRQVWSAFTFIFAIFQAIAAFLMAMFISNNHSYLNLFFICSLFYFLAAIMINFVKVNHCHN